MIIQFTLFIGIYFLILTIFIILAILNIYHIIKYGQGSTRSKLLLSIFLLGTGLILLLTIYFLSKIDLNQTIDLFKNIKFNNNLQF